MLKSAKNFALGFFGWPDEGQYEQVITIEADGVRFFLLIVSLLTNYIGGQFNNTLAPHNKFVFSVHYLVEF